MIRPQPPDGASRLYGQVDDGFALEVIGVLGKRAAECSMNPPEGPRDRGCGLAVRLGKMLQAAEYPGLRSKLQTAA